MLPVRRISVLVVAAGLLLPILSVVGVSSAASASTSSTASASVPSAAVAKKKPPKAANYVMPAGSYFSYPNRTKATKVAIRNKVLAMIRSTKGGPRGANGMALPGNGTIRIATWSFKDWQVARALVAAHKRGVSVQVVAAAGRNAPNPQWRFLKKSLKQKLYPKGKPALINQSSFARQCRGSCRGKGGTPHAKYFMFTNVGNAHVPFTVVQTSANLTNMAFTGQWNQAEVTHREDVYNIFLKIFNEARLNVPQRVPHRLKTTSDGIYANEFFPYHPSKVKDPVIRTLSNVRCANAGVGTPGDRTRIRIIQYTLYGDRGVYIAKRLRQLSGQGCDVKLIYAISTRPVISILRNNAGGRGIPLRQSVITGEGRVIVKYNHSKWMSIMGNIGGRPGQYKVMSGSSNWSSFAFSGDEQVQIIGNSPDGSYSARPKILKYNNAFNTTWAQKSSHAPGFGIKGQEGRMAERAWLRQIPNTIPWGKGIYKNVSPEGE